MCNLHDKDELLNIKVDSTKFTNLEIVNIDKVDEELLNDIIEMLKNSGRFIAIRIDVDTGKYIRSNIGMTVEEMIYALEMTKKSVIDDYHD